MARAMMLTDDSFKSDLGLRATPHPECETEAFIEEVLSCFTSAM